MLHYFFIIFILSTIPSNENTINISSSSDSPKEAIKIVYQFIDEAFKMSGYNTTLTILPSERAIENTNDGLYDADLIRIETVDKNYPNLHPVKFSLININVAIYYIDPNIKISKFDDIYKYSISSLIGHKFLDQKIDPTLVKVHSKVKNNEFLLRHLLTNRADLILATEDAFDIFLAKNNTTKTKLYKKRGFLKLETYLLLHTKHKNLIPKIEKNLKILKKQGKHDLMLEKIEKMKLK